MLGARADGLRSLRERWTVGRRLTELMQEAHVRKAIEVERRKIKIWPASEILDRALRPRPRPRALRHRALRHRALRRSPSSDNQ